MAALETGFVTSAQTAGYQANGRRTRAAAALETL